MFATAGEEPRGCPTGAPPLGAVPKGTWAGAPLAGGGRLAGGEGAAGRGATDGAGCTGVVTAKPCAGEDGAASEPSGRTA